MIVMRLSRAAEVVAGELRGEDGRFHGVSRDSRDIRAGELYAALPGARVDGHDFIAAAAAAGAVAALVSRPGDWDCPQIVVADVQQALGRLAAAWRRQLQPILVGITGSNGKTTVKEMVTTILRRDARVLSTQGNYNNELGVPLTLFRLGPKHQYAVIEMGANRPGDIAYLTSLAQPDVALVNNVGPAHLQGFGSLEGVAEAKGEIYTSLKPQATAVINADEPWQELWESGTPAQHMIRFGFNPGADIQGEILADETLTITSGDQTITVKLGLPGRHNRCNALAAAAIAIALGIPLEQIQAGLEQAVPVNGRLNTLQAPGGWVVIDDTYNANPASLYAGLQVLSGHQKETWLILGDMGELGSKARKLHAEMGEAAAGLGVSRLFTVGELSEESAASFGPNARHFPDKQQLLQVLLTEINPQVACLVKGSRSMGMELVVQALMRESSMQETG